MASAKADTLAADKVRAAQLAASTAGERCLSRAGGDQALAKRLLWQAQAGDKGLRLALLLVFAAHGEVRFRAYGSEPPELADPGMPDPGDPLSPAKVEAAKETYLAAIGRAVAQVRQGRDARPHADRRLIHAWARQDAELALAMVRLCVWGRVVVVDVLNERPEPAEPPAAAAPASAPTMH